MQSGLDSALIEIRSPSDWIKGRNYLVCILKGL